MCKPLTCVRGFHEKACLCQQQNLRSSSRGIAQGGLPSCGGSRRFLAAWGEPARPGFSPPGETGKGDFPFLPRCRRLLIRSACLTPLPSQPPTRPASIRTLVWSSGLRCHLVSSFLKRVLPSQCRTERLSDERTRSAAHSQSPELGDLLLNSKIPQATFCFVAASIWLFRSGS